MIASQKLSLRRLLLAAALAVLISTSAHAAPPADGLVIWQSTREDGRNEIYRAHADGTEVTRLTRTGATRPLWSPDGRWIAYTDDVAGVYVMRPDGTEVKKLS